MAPNPPTDQSKLVAEFRPEGPAPRPDFTSEELVRLGRFVARRDRITRAAAVDRIRRLDSPAVEQLRKDAAADQVVEAAKQALPG